MMANNYRGGISSVPCRMLVNSDFLPCSHGVTVQRSTFLLLEKIRKSLQEGFQ